MSYNLLIVESPAKAKTIQKFLGKNYKVAASMGHLRDLPKSKLGVDIENDFEVQYITVRGRGKQVNELKSLAKKARKVLLATDPDREGEAIAWHLAILLGLDLQEKNRVEFNEITKKRITEAVKEPAVINQQMVDAQQARRILDRIVGYKLSPLLWRKIKKGLSAGRVQSVALRLICEKEEQILAFVSEEYWSIEGDFAKGQDVITGKLQSISGGKVRIPNGAEAARLVEDIKKQNYLVDSLKTFRKENHPRAPFTTSTLQQEAAQKLNFTTKKTMMVAQQLYEGIKLEKETVGLITYIRTDSTRISQEAYEEAVNYIQDKYGDTYLPEKRRIYKSKGKAQDSHEAIRPSSVFMTPEKVKPFLSRDQYKLYTLIWQRMVASQMASAVVEHIKASIVGGEYTFTAQSSRTLFRGFQEVFDTREKGETQEIRDLVEKEALLLSQIRETQHFTQPPARFNEASLVKTLEDMGIGRPSTYAPIVTTILSRGYVVKEDKKFFPTELGIIVNELLVEYFSKIIDYDFTANLEEKLDAVEEEKQDWKLLLRDFYNTFRLDLEKADAVIPKIKVQEESTDEVCEKCGRNMVVRIGRYGKFLACPGFPECRNVKALLEETGVDCPLCKEGKVVVRRSKKGRKFYGCSLYPECSFVSWEEPSGKACPDCGTFMTRVTSKGKTRFKCESKTCGKEIVEENEDQDE